MKICLVRVMVCYRNHGSYPEGPARCLLPDNSSVACGGIMQNHLWLATEILGPMTRMALGGPQSCKLYGAPLAQGVPLVPLCHQSCGPHSQKDEPRDYKTLHLKLLAAADR